MGAYSRRLPARFALHILVGMMIPLAIVTSQLPLSGSLKLAPAAPLPQEIRIDPVAPLASLGSPPLDTPVPDSAFAAIDALPVRPSALDLLASQPVPATIAVDMANVRGGPGSNYDKVADLPSGTAIQLLARVEGWYQARTADGRIVWIAAELLSANGTAMDLLPPAANIPAPPPAKVGQVATDGLNLRDGPGTNYIGMTHLANGSQLDLLARYNDWLQVQTADGKVGWVLGQHLSIGQGVLERVEAVSKVPDANPALLGTVSERNVNMRSGPSSQFEKRASLSDGTRLELLGRYQDWYKVRTPSGAIGWVSNELIALDDYIARRVPVARDIPALPKPQLAQRPASAAPAQQPVAPLPAPAVSAGSATALAVKFVGARYAWGGASPSGFDCSGFTQYVYKQFGMSLPHSSAGQYSTQYGTRISNMADLQPGDLVFFVNTYKRGISHVGIYIGGGNVVQALSPKQGVGVANLNSGYWSQHYYGGIRPAR